MDSADQRYRVVKNRIGFYEVQPRPTQHELSTYYAEKYYQQGVGSYELEYSDAERLYFRNKNDQKSRVLSRLLRPKSTPFRLLDVGCGEGWSLAFFKGRGWSVTGLDFSSFGCEKFNPDCSIHLRTGDLYQNIESLISEGETFDCVWLVNLLEHVVEPIALLNDLKWLVVEDGILVVQVPNDFSELHRVLSRDKLVSREFWVAPPDHLSYFNREGLRSITAHTGWRERFLMSDYWIELNVFNPHANYVEDRTLGKGAHRSRISIENLFHEISPDKTVALYQAAAELGIGRNLIGFYSKA